MTEKKIYIWDTSIPDTWKKIAGEDHFVHISKSNRAKNTLEFLQETQRYILKIRSSIQESNSLVNLRWSDKIKRRSQLSQKKLTSLEGDRTKLIEPVSSVLLPSISKKSLKEEDNEVKKVIFRKNLSVNSLPSGSMYLKYLNQNSGYSKVKNERPPDFICLPKALKASFNRVINSLRT